jgi:HEAT repeat protein
VTEDYLPASNFLVSVANEEVPIDDTDFGQANLRKLIAMTRDTDVSNRDWAAMLLAGYGPQTEEVRDVLLAAAEDEDQYVRAEAIEGLVSRDREKALGLAKRELTGGFGTVPVLYAAIELADPSLFAFLEPFAEPSGDEFLDGLTDDALNACRHNY